MVKTASLSSRIPGQIPRAEFARIAHKHQGERHARGFTCGTQFVGMLFCQLAHADSLREICNGLACCLGKLVYVGIKDAPNKSTLSYANQHRPAALYEDLFWTILDRFRVNGQLGAKKHKFRFKNSSNSTSANLDSHGTMIQGDLNLENVISTTEGLIIWAC